MNKIIIDQIFQSEKSVLETLRKEYSSNLLPLKDMELEDAAWDNSKRIEKVTINLKDNYYILHVSPENINKDDLLKKVEMYKLHGWKNF